VLTINYDVVRRTKEQEVVSFATFMVGHSRLSARSVIAMRVDVRDLPHDQIGRKDSGILDYWLVAGREGTMISTECEQNLEGTLRVAAGRCFGLSRRLLHFLAPIVACAAGYLALNGLSCKELYKESGKTLSSGSRSVRSTGPAW
jgi:hypothetical protein